MKTKDGIIRIIKSLKIGFSISFLTIGIGYGLAHLINNYFGPCSRTLVIVLQLISAFLLLGATLSVLGLEIATYGMKTLPEKINRVLYVTLYAIGTGILIISLFIKTS